jgi:hypothetical protein
MKPQTVGRVLGTGLRVAGRLAGEKLAGSAQAPMASSSVSSTAPGAPLAATAAVSAKQAGENVRRAGGSVARGVGGFLRPFGRVGGIVFLEVTGVFFLLFVLVFGQMAWRMRASYAAGPDHAKFLASVVLMLVFLYLSASSFWRSRRR